MGIFSNLFGERRDLSGLDPEVLKALNGNPSLTGILVDERKALRVAAVWSCASILADTIAALPLHVYRRTTNGKERASDHPLDRLLNVSPNPWMTAFTLRQAMMLHLAVWRNAYIQIVRDGTGQVVELWPLLPDATKPNTTGGVLTYKVTLPDGTPKTFRADQILHVRGLTINGLEGLSVIKHARETLGSILAMQEYGSRFFSNGANPGGVVTTDEALSKEQKRQLAEAIAEQVKGLAKAHELLVLSNGAKFTPIGVDPKNSQLNEQRRFEIEEVARWFKIPPHKLGLTDKGMSYASVEQMQLAFVQESLLPWLVQIEQSIAAFVLTQAESKVYYVKHIVEGLLRGDTKTRYEAYHFALTDGWLNRDEVRELEDRNPMPNGDGQKFLVPLNMTTADQVANQPGATDGGTRNAPRPVEKRALDVAQKRRRLCNQYLPLFTDAASRFVHAEVSDIKRKAKEIFGKRDATQFSNYLEAYYLEHPERIERALLPVLRSYIEAVQENVADELDKVPGMTPELENFVREYVKAYAKRHAEGSLGQLQAVLKKALEENADPLEAVNERLDEWEQTRAEKIGRRESIRALNAFAKAAMVAYGITKLRWNAGDSCPHCRELDGKIVEINAVFMHAGDVSEPDGAPSSLKTYTSVGHPPAHDGCDCVITAG